MNTTRIYTNGISFFTLENFAPNTATCEAHKITLHDEVSKNMARAMHSNGSLHYIFGTGDRKELAGVAIKRKSKFEGFEVH